LSVVAIAGLRDSAVWAWMNAHPRTLVMQMLRPIREEWRLPLYELGSGQYILPLSGVLYLSGRLSHRVALRDAGLGCAAGHLASLGVRDVIYELVSRARPRVTPEPYHISFPGSNDWSWHSFISGHISNSMACASFLGHRYHLGPAEPLPYIYSAAIGLGRIADGRHWLSDTMTGALVGFAIGRTIAGRQLARAGRQASAASPARDAAFTPVVRWSFTF
jgi:membrane-associated phospholipid phosphatase